MISTNRLILRPFTNADIPALFDLLSDKEVNTYLPWYPLIDINEVLPFIKSKFTNTIFLLICLKETNKPIGYITLSNDDSHELGYALSKTYWHQGYTTEATKAFLQHLITTDIPYLTATHDIHNLRSKHVMQALGMQYQYSYKEQWQPKNILVTFSMYELNLKVPKDFVYKGYWLTHPDHYIELTSNT